MQEPISSSQLLHVYINVCADAVIGHKYSPFSWGLIILKLTYILFQPGYRYVSKTATKTQVEFDYEGPSMKTSVPGPRSQVIHKYQCALFLIQELLSIANYFVQSVGIDQTTGRNAGELIFL